MKNKIDTTLIEGFDGMTAEEQVKALLNFEYEDNAEVVKNYKENIDRLTHEVSQTKKDKSAEIKKLTEEIKSRMSENELKEKEHQDYVKALEEQNELYKANERVSHYTAKLIESGYDSETAKQMASGLPDGMTDDFFDSQKKFLESQQKTFEEKALNKQPDLSTSSTEPNPEDVEIANYKRWAGL